MNKNENISKHRNTCITDGWEEDILLGINNIKKLYLDLMNIINCTTQSNEAKSKCRVISEFKLEK